MSSTNDNNSHRRLTPTSFRRASSTRTKTPPNNNHSSTSGSSDTNPSNVNVDVDGESGKSGKSGKKKEEETYETIILNPNGDPLDTTDTDATAANNNNNNNNNNNTSPNRKKKGTSKSSSSSSSSSVSNVNHDNGQVMVSAFQYKGLELIISCTNGSGSNGSTSSTSTSGSGCGSGSGNNGPNESCIHLITARSRMTLQTLYMDEQFNSNTKNTTHTNTNTNTTNDPNDPNQSSTMSQNDTNDNDNDNTIHQSTDDIIEVEMTHRTTTTHYSNTPNDDDNNNNDNNNNDDNNDTTTTTSSSNIKITPTTSTSNVNSNSSNSNSNSNSSNSMTKIITMKTNSISGCITIITSNCKSITYYPIPSNSKRSTTSSSTTSTNTSNGGNGGNDTNTTNVIFGNYIWIQGNCIDLKLTFDQMVNNNSNNSNGNGNGATTNGQILHRRRKLLLSTPSSSSSSSKRNKTRTGTGSNAGSSASASPVGGHNKYACVGLSSIDYKLLIAYADQIAIYSIPPPPSSSSSSTSSSQSTSTPKSSNSATASASEEPTTTTNNRSSHKEYTPQLQWTTRVRATITNCDLSGDGRSIVYTLDKEGVGVPYPYGVRSFIRDVDDGSDDHLYAYGGSGGSGGGRSSNSGSGSKQKGGHERKVKFDSGGDTVHTGTTLNASGHNYKKPPITDTNKRSGGTTTGSSSGTSSTSSRNLKGSVGGITPPPIPMDQDYSSPLKQQEESDASDASTPTTDPNSSPTTPIKTKVVVGMGILYKAGPFLVHSNPVTRLSFRGHGMNYSSISSDYEMKKKKLKKKQMSKSKMSSTMPPTSPTSKSSSTTKSSSSSSKTSSTEIDILIEGNDLLLTSCSSDGSMRVFSEGTWKMLLHWDTPPGSRADWIQGITMANLGDLDPFPKSSKKKKSVSGENGYKSSSSSGDGGGNYGNGNKYSSSSQNHGSGGTVNKQLLKAMTARNGSNSTQVQTIPTSTTTTSSGGWNTHPSPQCAAGAWISELTFRGPFPALRLSRLSFLKSGGGDAWAPAHFESIAAILPPATVLPQAVLESFCGDEGMGMVVQGVWPAWNRWVAHPNAQSGVVEDESLSGNAMALLGAVPQGMMNVSGGGTMGAGGGGNMGAFGGTGGMSMASFGGSHSPPSELRLVASHPDGDKVVVMEFPLWGDSDFGAMELGSPLRYLLSLNEQVPEDVVVGYGQNVHNAGKSTSLQITSGKNNTMEIIEEDTDIDYKNPTHAPLPVTISTRCACLDFESNNLCAVVTNDRKHIGLTWRKKGTMNIVSKPPAPLGDYEPLQRTFSDVSIASTASLDSAGSHASFLSKTTGTVIEQFSDLSLTPVPLSLPSLHLHAPMLEKERFSLLKWWPDENFGGPPRLFAMTTLGTLILYEMPPPWSTLEPIMPMDDPFAIDAMSSLVGMSDNSVVSERSNDEEGVTYENEMFRPEEEIISEYEVQVTPHTDFGLGLRLEAQADGMPAIAGSYKKHPLTGGRLPAERTGRIVLGDELVSVNDVSLEGMTFDDIISTVRLIGSKSQAGTLSMKFRTVEKNRFLRENLSNLSAEQLTFDEGLEVVHQRSTDEGEETKSSASAVGVDTQMEPGFGRVVAVVPDALPSFTSSVGSPRSWLLLPWHYGKGAPVPYQVQGAVLLVSAVGRKITASRLEILNGVDPSLCGILNSLGSVELDSNSGDQNTCSPIKSLAIIKNAGDGWCISACDETGGVHLIFIDIVDNDDTSNNVETDRKLCAVFKTNFIFNCCQKESSKNVAKDYLVRAPSIELLGTMPVGNSCSSVNVWTSAPYVYYHNDNEEKEQKGDVPLQSYSLSKVYHRGDSNCESHRILDFRWITSGHMDSFPWLVTFSNRSVVVHRRPGWHNEWMPIAEMTYPAKIQSKGAGIISSDTYQGSLSPADAYPHLMAALRTIVTATDERNYIKSDWNPDSILAVVYSDPGGVELGMKRHVGGLLKWLSTWLDPTDSTNSHWDKDSKLSNAPFDLIYDNDAKIGEDTEKSVENAAELMRLLSVETKSQSKEELLLLKLQNCLKGLIDCDKENSNESGTSREFNVVMNQMNTKEKGNYVEDEYLPPEPLNSLNKNELYLLWAIGQLYSNPPKFEKLDESAKIAILAVSLLRHIQTKDNRDSSLVEANSPPLGTQNRSFLVKQTSSSMLSSLATKSKPPRIASSATLAALLSDTQKQLLESCRIPNERLDWETARSMNLSFWLRSDDELKKISQEIGQSTYKETKDVLEAALFYVAIGNTQMLKSIAATDANMSGKTFFKFISNHDFSSPRGRKAAEKNAYSLLRKRRYRPAVSFFLLAKPPMLKSALNIIVTKMEDLALAFFVARLVETNLSRTTTENGNGLTIGGGLSLRGMGGGGGFASMGGPMSMDIVKESLYSDWKPKLSNMSRDLLEKHGLSAENEDDCLKAVQLLWLCRSNDAAMSVIGHEVIKKHETNFFSSDEYVPISLEAKASSKGRTANGYKAKVMAEANSMMDFTSRPHLLKRLKVPQHASWFSSIQIARALCRRGFDLPAIMTLSRTEDELNTSKLTPETNRTTKENSGLGNTNSSIFDSFSPAPKVSAATTQPVSSSIFDNFEPPPKPKQSSIFDSFDVPSSSNRAKSNEQTTSSIFDSFDPAPSKPSQSKSPAMASSIFDSFDVPTSSTKAPPAQTSSIFDSFDVPTASKKAPPIQTQSSGVMSSSIFDSFDAPSSGKVAIEPQIPSQDVISKNPMDKSSEDGNQNATVDSKIADILIPPIWLEWRRNILTSAVAKRLIREMARIIAPFLGDIAPIPMKLFRRHIQPLIPYGASHVLHEVCEGEAVLSLIVDYLDQLCTTFDVSKASVIEQALLLLACPSQPQRIVFAVLLHCLTARADLAEDVIRHAAHDQMQRCETFIAANDDLVQSRKTKHHVSSQYVRRQAAMVSLQLELCLWLHRGGAFPISGLALKETTIGVRVGLVVAAWGRCHECLEHIIKCEPDCAMDFERGRQLWSSMKMILSFCAKEEKSKGGETTSGGWEFLVDCNREEATDLLRNRRCGSFLLRPHPDDHGVFTLSFRTNLTPDSAKNKEIKDESEKKTKVIKRDDVVQHAVVRLSDAGFKCGSFGPFSSLLKLLEAVSTSLPFDLLFNEPPAQGIIKEEGGQPSPNSVFIRKLALHSKTDHYRWNSSTQQTFDESEEGDQELDLNDGNESKNNLEPSLENEDNEDEFQIRQRFGMFSQLLVLTELRKQFSAVVGAEDEAIDLRSHWDENKNNESGENVSTSPSNFDESFRDSFDEIGEEEMDAIATRTIRPFLSWCRAFETLVVNQILPMQPEITQLSSSISTEVLAQDQSTTDCGDGIIRRMIQPRSGVEFRTLRVGEAGHSAVIVLFRKSEAISWIVSSGAEKSEADAIKRLDIMERRRVIEQVDLKLFAPDKQVVGLNGQEEKDLDGAEKEVRFRFVDPWEVEVIESKDAELRPASLGRQRYVPFTIGSVARACEDSQRSLGGLHLLSLWSAIKGGVCLTKAFASVFPSWERDAGGDLYVVNGMVTQPSSYSNSFRQHLYRNSLFRRMNLPQRFIAIVQVELLDLKNLTSPGGSPSLTAYALLRLKRDASNAPLTHKARTLDSASTEPRKISKSSGPNAPASWGSVVRFRFPLPEAVNCDGVSFDKNREALFKGAPSVLQLSVYEKKFMNDVALGGADVRFDGLSTDGQVEEWVPLISASDDITWFARIRLMLRFELMCMEPDMSSLKNDSLDSAGLKKIRLLSRIGGAHEDAKGVQKSISTPDMVAAFQSMV